MTSFHGQLRDSYAELQGKQKSAAGRAAAIRRLQLLLQPHLPAAGQCAVDLGAGQGELVEALQRLGYTSVEGIELSPSRFAGEVHGCSGARGDAGQALANNRMLAGSDLLLDVFEHLSQTPAPAGF